MIKNISFNNYKSFKQGSIKIKPLTLFLGVNSIGKSSVLQLLLMLSQTITTEKTYKSPLKLNGDLVSLGEFKNLFHGQQTDKPFIFSIKTDKKNKLIRGDMHDRISQIATINRGFINNIFDQLNHEDDSYNFDENLSRCIFKDWISRYDKEKILIALEEIRLTKNRVNKILRKKDSPEIIHEINSSRIPEFKFVVDENTQQVNIDVNEFYDIIEVLKLYDIYSNSDAAELCFKVSYNHAKRDIYIQQISLICNSKTLISYKLNKAKKGKRHHLESDYLDQKILNKYSTDFGRKIRLDKLSIYQKPGIEEASFSNYVFTLFRMALDALKHNLQADNINYVSPLRAFPKRFYFLDKSNISSCLDTINGDQLAEILQGNKNIKKQVNNWFQRFNLNIDVSNLKDVIHKINIRQNEIDLDITDVGFGISQVLPVIVQGLLSADGTTTLIEQPEIHLHPKMQAELADLFIDIIYANNKESTPTKTLIIETHSEYLLKRLRRRISEGSLKAEDIGIYFFNQNNKPSDGTNIESVEISPTGAFNWPNDFYADDLNDTIEFLKNQN